MDFQLFSMFVVLTSLVVMLTGFSYLQNKCHVHPEITRKSVHVGMGLVTLSFPWVFNSYIPVLLLAGIASVSLVLIRSIKFLRKNAGSALNEVERKGFGELFFPIGVAVIFTFYDGEILLYVIPILILTFADALAAIVGRFSGRLFFTTPDGLKTLEGSGVFVLIAFLCIFFPLTLFSDLTLINVILIAVLLSLIVTLFEAVSWSGLDNLFIPVFSFLLLKKYLVLDNSLLLIHISFMAALLVFLIIWRKSASLRTESILMATLFGYFTWAIGGWPWFTIALLALVSYPFLTPRIDDVKVKRHGIQVILHVAGTGVVWLVVSQVWQYDISYFIFVLGYATHLSIILLVRHKAARPRTGTGQLVVQSIVKSFAVLFIPFIFFTGVEFNLIWLMLVGLLLVSLACMNFVYVCPDLRDYKLNIKKERWILQTSLVMLYASISIVPITFLLRYA